MICPRCNQGEIFKVLINKLQAETFLCDECDAMWFKAIDIGNVPFVDFGTYMISEGLSPTWDEMIVVNSSI